MKKGERNPEEVLGNLSKDLDKLLVGALKQNEELKKQNNFEGVAKSKTGQKVSEDKQQASTEIKTSKNSSQEKSSIWSKFINYVISFFSESEKKPQAIEEVNPQVQQQNSPEIKESPKGKSWGAMLKDPFGLNELEAKRNEHLQKAAESFKAAGTNLVDAKKGIEEMRENNTRMQKKSSKFIDMLEAETKSRTKSSRKKD